MATTLFPLQYLRQGADPIDVDSVFATTADRIAYLANGRRYPGQVVADLEENKVYCLDNTGTSWIEVGGGGGIPGGLDGQVQFNDGGVFGGNSGFTYDSATSTVGLSKISNPGPITVEVTSTPAWYSLYGDLGIDVDDDYSSSIVYDSLGNIYSIGADGNTGIPFLLKYSPSGTLLWQKTFTEVNNYYKSGDAVAVDGDDNIYCSISIDDAIRESYIIKLDGSGNIIWQIKLQNFNGSDYTMPPVTDMMVDGSGNLYAIVGVRKLPSSWPSDTVLIKFSSSGVLQWQRKLSTVDANDSLYPQGIWVDSAGNSHIVMTNNNTSTPSSRTTVAKYTTSGALDWQNEYILSATPYNYGYNITGDSTGNIYFTLDANLMNIVKVDSTGALVWNKEVDVGLYTYSSGVALDSTGNVYVSGGFQSDGPSGSGRDYLILKYTVSGSLVWQRSFGGLDNDYTYYYWATRNLDVIDENYVISGYTYSPALSNSEAIVVQLKTDGSGTGVYGNFTYGIPVITETTPIITVQASTLISTVAGLAISTGSLVAADLTKTATYTYMFGGGQTWSFNTDGSLSLPGYSIPGGDGVAGALLQTDGAGTASWTPYGLPTADGAAGQVLTTDGAGIATWQNSASTAGGTNTQVQFNDNGAFGGSSGFIYCNTTCTLGITTLQPSVGQGLNVNFNNDTTPASWYNVQGPFGYNNKNTYSAGVAVDSNNNVYTLYNVNVYSPYDEYTVLEKYNSDGILQYQKKMAQTGDAIRAANIDVDSTGSVIALTTTAANSSHITKYTSGGSVVWSKEITGVAAAEYFEAGGLVIDSTDNIIITGNFSAGAPTYNESIPLIKFDSNGAILWQKQILVTDSYSGNRVTVDASDNIYVGGLTFNVGRPFVAKFDSLGNLLWQRQSNSNIIGRLGGLTVDASGNVYISGSSSVYPDEFCYVIKFDNSGNTVWLRNVNFGPFGYVRVHGLTVDPTGNIYVKGTFNRDTNNNTSKIFVLKITSFGSIIWSRTWYGIISEYIYEQPGQGIVATNNYYTFIGDTESFNGNYNISKSLVVKLPADGSLTGVYPVFDYESVSVTITVAPFTFVSSAYSISSLGFGVADSSITITTATENNYYYLISSGANLDYTLSQTSLQLPGYSLPVGAGVQWQSLTSNGDGTVGWSYPCSQLDYRGNYFIGGGQAVDCCAKSNISIGLNALSNNTYGYGNVAFAQDSLRCNTCGSYNLAVGYGAMHFNTTGYGNIGMGYRALQYNITGSGNTAVGYGNLSSSNVCNAAFNSVLGYAGMRYSSGNQYCNVAIGPFSMHYACNHYGSIGIGNSVFYFSSGGCNNIALGYNSQFSNAGFRNISMGESSLLCNSTGGCNIAIGSCTLQFNTTGSANIAVGHLAGCLITTGNNNTVIGSLTGSAGLVCTVLIGAGTCERIKVDNTGLYVNGSLFGGGGSPATPTTLGTVFGYTTGNGNTSIGCCAGNTTNTGVNNIAVGCLSLASLTYGNNNISLGRNALVANTSGCNNIALGCSSLRSNTTGAGNIGIGNFSLCFNSTGSRNIAIGCYAMHFNCTGNDNIAQGYSALYLNTAGSHNIALGLCALKSNTTGSYNFAAGQGALCLNTTGVGNIAIGVSALAAGYNNHNIAQGYQSMISTGTGRCNVAIGIRTLFSNCTGSENVAVGVSALYNTLSSGNTAVGSNALGCISGEYNTGLGFNAGQGLSGPWAAGCVVAIGPWSLLCNRGNSNIGVGACAGCNITTGTNNTVIGSLPAAAGCLCTLLIGAGTCERVRVDNSGLYINGSLYPNSLYDTFTNLTGATGVVTHDFSLGPVFRHTSIASNFTVNVTNIGLASGSVTNISLLLVQGATAYMANALQIAGVGQTINWRDGSAPTGTANKVDIVNFSILNNSGTYTVIGQGASFG